MNEATEEFFKQWLIKAQEDWDVARILTDQENPPATVACFHCQQCVEKLLKAILVREQVEFPKTHDLGRLIELVSKWVPELTGFSASAKQLTIYGVENKIPGRRARCW